MDDTEEPVYTKESKILAIAPKVPAFLSILGSAYIVYNILFVQRKKNETGRFQLYHQLMLMLSLSDILASHIYFLGTFLIPRGSGGPFGLVYWAFGTDKTCSYSGFFNQFAVASPLYNTMLSVYFLLKIRYGWKEYDLARIGPFFHMLPLAFAMGTAFFALFRQPDTLYGNVFWTCWINPDPPQPDFRWFQWSFLFAPVWACVLFQTIAMTFLYMSVRNVEEETKQVEEITKTREQEQNKSATRRRSDRQTTEDSWSEEDDYDETEDGTNFDGSDKSGGRHQHAVDEEQPVDAAAILAARAKKQQHSRMIAIQGILYVGAFYVSWIFPTIQRILELAGARPIFAMQALDTTLLPLQGIFNVYIYLRPKYVFYRRKYPDLPVRNVLQMVHNRSKEGTIVEKYTTKLQSKMSRNNKSNMSNSVQSNNNRGVPTRSRDTLDFDQPALPTIGEGQPGEESSTMQPGSNMNLKMESSTASSNNNYYQNNNNNINSQDDTRNIVTPPAPGSSRAAGVRMDGSMWRSDDEDTSDAED